MKKIVSTQMHEELSETMVCLQHVPELQLGLGRFTDAPMYRDTYKLDAAIVSWTVVSIQNDT